MESINIDERVVRARENHKRGYNCAQSVVLAYSDIFGIDEQILATLSASFGGGLGRMREVCGAVSGMGFVASTLHPGAADPTNKEAKMANYTNARLFAESFREECGSIICRELLGLDANNKKVQVTQLKPTQTKMSCTDRVATAARIVGEYINNMK